MLGKNLRILLTASLLCATAEAGLDVDERLIEQVKSPYVVKHDLGQYAHSANNKPAIAQYSSRSSHQLSSGSGQASSPCISCKYVPGRVSSSRSSSHYSSNFNTPPVAATYSRPGRQYSQSPGTFNYQKNFGSHAYGSSAGSYAFFNSLGNTFPTSSSSKHELREEKKFVNGQQVYDLHHEKRYQDGSLIHEEKSEKNKNEFAPVSSSFAQGAASNSNNYNQMKSGYQDRAYTNNRGNTYNLHRGNAAVGSSGNAITNTEKQHSFYHQSTDESGYSGPGGYKPASSVINHQNNQDKFLENFYSGFKSTGHSTPYYYPNNGGHHRTEYRTETRYVNGKPVFVRKEERKYKNGQLVHNRTDEKGPRGIGSANVYQTNSHNLGINTAHLASFNPVQQQSNNQYYSNIDRHHSTRIEPQNRYNSDQITNSRIYGNQQFENNNFQTDLTLGETRNLHQNNINNRDAFHNTLEGTKTQNTLSSSNHSTFTNRSLPISTSIKTLDNDLTIKFNVGDTSHSSSSNTTTTTGHHVSTNQGFILPGVSTQGKAKTTLIGLTDLNNNKPSHNLNLGSFNEGVVNHHNKLDERIINEHDIDNKRYDINPYDGYPVSNEDLDNGFNQDVTYTRAPIPDRRLEINNSNNNYSNTQNIYKSQTNTQSYAYNRTNTNHHNSSTGLNAVYNQGISTPVVINQQPTNVIHQQAQSHGYNRIDETNQQYPGSYYQQPISEHPTNLGNKIYQKTEHRTNTTRTQILPVTHNYRHVVRKEKKFINGKQVHDLYHEKRFKDDDLIYENKTHGNPDDYSTDYQQQGHLQFDYGIDNSNFRNNDSFINTGLNSSTSGNTQSYAYYQKQQQGFKDNQQIYGLNHEKVFQNGQLVHENKTEQGPRSYPLSGHEDALKSLLAGKSYGSSTFLKNRESGRQRYLQQLQHQQQQNINQQSVPLQTQNNQHISSTQAHGTAAQHHLLVGNVHGQTNSNLQSQHQAKYNHAFDQKFVSSGCSSCMKNVYNQLGSTSSFQAGTGSFSTQLSGQAPSLKTFTKKSNASVEEHYVDGKLVSGKEEKRQWENGDLVRHDSRIYSGQSTQSQQNNTNKLDYLNPRPLILCDQNPCQNGATCFPSTNGYICTCAFGFKGKNCDVPYCPRYFCNSGGTCSIQVGHHVCHCPRKYSGKRCEHKDNW